jgi:hypothetical protein
MSSLVSTVVLLAVLMGASSSTGVAQQSVRPAGVQVSTSPMAGSIAAASVDVIGDLFVPGQPQENVLVVPTPELPAESLADLTEDLSIMCHIFDKCLPATGNSVNLTYGDRADPFHWVVAQPGRGTQGLYLDGYGALFFIRVDYPLVPTGKQEAAQPKPKEPEDSVWSQTAREMSSQRADEPQTPRSAPVYDAQKVTDLKETLIKTLVHASNIRMRRPQDMITLVVGALEDVRGPISGRLRGTGTVRTEIRTGVVPGGVQAGTRDPATALMVLRVGKADVDAFAKGQLTLIQFTDEVQVLFSPGVSNAPAASATTPTTVGTGRQSGLSF